MYVRGKHVLLLVVVLVVVVVVAAAAAAAVVVVVVTVVFLLILFSIVITLEHTDLLRIGCLISNISRGFVWEFKGNSLDRFHVLNVFFRHTHTHTTTTTTTTTNPAISLPAT